MKLYKFLSQVLTIGVSIYFYCTNNPLEAIFLIAISCLLELYSNNIKK